MRMINNYITIPEDIIQPFQIVIMKTMVQKKNLCNKMLCGEKVKTYMHMMTTNEIHVS